MHCLFPYSRDDVKLRIEHVMVTNFPHKSNIRQTKQNVNKMTGETPIQRIVPTVVPRQQLVYEQHKHEKCWHQMAQREHSQRIDACKKIYA